MSKNNNLEDLKKSSSNLNKILLILMIIFTSIFWAFAFYAPIEYSQGEYQIKQDDSSYLNITQIKLNYNADMVSVNIKFEDDIHYILDSNWKQITSPSFPHDAIDIHFQETFLDNQTLEINVTSTGEGSYDSDWNLFYEFEIVVDNSYLIDFNSEVSYSQVNIEASNTEFGNFCFKSESGRLDVEFYDVYIQSPINILNSYGSTDLIFNRCNITSDINFEGDSGSQYFSAYDSVFANINMQTDSGYINFYGNSNNFNNLTIGSYSSILRVNIGISSIKNINLTSSSGTINLDLNEIILDGDVSISSTSGTVDCEFDEISFYSNRTFDIKSDSGYTDFSWDQEILMNSSAIINIETISSSIDVDISTLQANIDSERFILYTSTETGYIDVNLYEGNYE